MFNILQICITSGNDLSCLLEIIKVRKVEKLVVNLHDKNLIPLIYGVLVLKIVHEVIKFNWKA